MNFLVKNYKIACSYFLSLSVMFIVSCASMPKERITFNPAPGMRFESEKQPAEITRLSGDALRAQEYIKIGDLSVTQVARECHEKADAIWNLKPGYFPDCREHSYDAGPTAVLIKKAAENGARLVLLVRDRESSTLKVSTMSSLCKTYRTEKRLEQRTHWRGTTSVTEQVWVEYSVCSEYYPKNGEQYLVTSEASLWRKGN